ncbi:MAG TPA: sugar transferase [Nitrospirae bacterium]|nr:UDP-glucose:undecaprenyl-phosphate glucose-1-phosphate transferase [bacterium BMS3Abin06]HDH11606.1 sugar transferase [Nitrospirota bacterium]HDZ02026.1 sugar transferase [Nitrospirota bacterium]
MLSFRRKLLLNLFKLSDICILIVALAVASMIVLSPETWMTLGDFFSLQIKVIHIIGLFMMILFWHLIFHTFQLYCSRRLKSKVSEWKDILKATMTGTVILAIARHVFSIDIITPFFCLVFWLSSTVLTISFRSILRSVLARVRLYGRNLRFVLIVGTNQRAYDFANKLGEKMESGYRLIGYIDKNIYRPKEGMNLLGTIEDFSTVMKNNVIDEIVIALPIKSYYEEIQEIVQKAEEQGIVIRYLPQLFNTRVAESRAEIFEDVPILTMQSGHQNGWQYVTKRAIDLILASVLITLTLPLMVFAAIATKLTSPGPVLFIQERIGYNKRVFRFYKFRTMEAGAEKQQAQLEHLNEMDGPVFKIQNDPRITRVGKWLRKWSIDELPQLFNVIKGDMSLVGPRPLPLRDFNNFEKDWQHRRCSVLPGMTCTWQVNGRNKISFEDWITLDMAYIDNWKVTDDLKILCKTIPAVMKKKGAA